MRDSDILSRTPQTVVEIPVLLHSKTAIKKTPLFDFLQFRTIDSIQELQLFFYKYLYYNVIEIDLVKRDTLNKTVAYLKNTFDLTISKDNSVYKGNYDKDVLFNTFILDLYYIDDDLFRNICHEIFIFNVNGDFQIFSKQETKDYVRNLKKELGIEKARQLIKNQIYRKKYKSDDSDCNNLSSFLNFFLKNGKILFWSKKENFKRHETIYKNLEDKRPISIRIDIEAIIRYSVIAFNSNLYKKSSVWSEHLLLKMAGGVSVVNEDFYIVYANERRRRRHKNNILGKKCYEVFVNRNKICENCSLEKQFKSYSHSTNNILSENSGKIKLKVKSSECNEIEILDKANNKYFMVEHNTSIFTNAYSTHLGVMTCQDVNFRHEIIELAKNIQEPIKSNEFNEPTRHIKPDEIYNRIINTFKNKLGFNRVRLYLNFSSKRGSANVPILVLVNHIGYDSSRVGIPEVGLKIYFDDLSEKIFKEKGTQNKFSILDYFVDSKYRNLHIFNYGDIAEPDCRVSKLSKKLDLKERWVDVPLWIGEELIGAIGVDYDDDDIKWDMINEDIKFQLMQGSVFLASAIKNSFLINNSVRFTNISRKISELKLAGKKEEELLKLLSEEFDANVVFHFYKFCDYGFKLSSSYSIQESWTKITDSFIYLGDTENCILSKKEGRHFANEKNFENRTELEVHKKENGKLNSVISIYLRSNGKVVAILLGTKYNKNENNLPFSNYDYVFLRSVSEQAGEILHNFYFKQGYDKIIFAVANSISKIERIEDFGVKFFKSIRELYPKTYITLYQKKRGKLILIADSEIKNENKQLAKLVYNLPSESIPNKLQWIKEQESGFTTSFLYREDKVYYYKNRELLNEAIAEYYPKHEKDRIVTYYDAQYEDRKELQSEIIKVIKYKDQPIGIIRFQDNLTDSYDEYFIDFVKTLASQIGNIVGLLNELEERKDFERSFFHELKAPVAAMSGNLNLFPYRMGFSPEEFKQIGLEINNKLPRLNRKRDSRANIEDPDYILIPKNKLFPLLQVLNLRDRLLQFILNDPDIFDVSKPIRYSFKKEVDLKKIVSSICRTLQFNAEKSEDDKKLLFETKKLFSKIIVGDERYLELAFYNIFSNVIKYSLRINGSYVRNILIDWEDHDQIFIIRITNYGKTFSPDESQQVLELEKRGSNSLNIEGKGLGLFLANRIFNSHSALLKLIPYPDEFKTETTITFNLHLNSKLSDET